MANFIYNAAKVSFGKGEIDWVNDDVSVALLTSAYTPNKDTHQYFSDVVANEASGTGYTTGGFALAGKVVTQDNTNDRAVHDANDVSASGLTVTYRYYCVYQDTGVNSTSRLITLIDAGTDQVIDASTLDLAFPVSGVFYLE